MTDDQLVRAATEVLNPLTSHDGRLFGDVAAALLTRAGHLYRGVCVDTSSWGLCAERSAMAAMITAGELEVARIVAVWRDPESRRLHLLPPCGICREFLRSVHPANLQTAVVLGRERSVPLAELLPEHAWPEAYGEPDRP